MKIQIKAFGMAREILGGTTEIDFEGITVKDLRDELHARYPDLKSLASIMVAVNQQYAPDDIHLSTTDEIVLIPPVSGG